MYVVIVDETIFEKDYDITYDYRIQVSYVKYEDVIWFSMKLTKIKSHYSRIRNA